MPVWPKEKKAHFPEIRLVFQWETCYNINVIRPWRSWISQQIPILKAGGSNPSGRASREPRRASRVRGFSFYYDVALAFVVGIYFVNASQLKAPMRKLPSELLFYPLDLWLFIYRRNVVLCKEILIYGVIFR